MDIYVQKDGQKLGPFSETKVRHGIDAGEFSPDDLAWTTGKASWQRLSALICLDSSQPPPVKSPNSPTPRSTPVNLDCRSGLLANSLPIEPPAPYEKVVVPSVTKTNKRRCTRCGAPYSLWSPFHAMGSGLCTRCSKATAKPRQPPIHQRPIETRSDALKVIRITTALYMGLAVLDFIIGYGPMGAIILVCSFGVWLYHSRVASIILMLLAILSIVVFFIEQGVTNFSVNRIWIMVAGFQILLTCKAIEATFKLHKESLDSSSTPDRQQNEASDLSLPSPAVYWVIATTVMIVSVGILLFQPHQDGTTNEHLLNSTGFNTSIPTHPWRNSFRPSFLPEKEGEFSVERHRHMFDPSPTPARSASINPPLLSSETTSTKVTAVLRSSESDFKTCYGEPGEVMHDGPVETDTFVYEYGDWIVRIGFLKGLAQHIAVAKVDRTPMNENDAQVALFRFAEHQRWNRAKGEDGKNINAWGSSDATALLETYHYKVGAGSESHSTLLRIMTDDFYREYSKSISSN